MAGLATGVLLEPVRYIITRTLKRSEIRAALVGEIIDKADKIIWVITVDQSEWGWEWKTWPVTPVFDHYMSAEKATLFQMDGGVFMSLFTQLKKECAANSPDDRFRILRWLVSLPNRKDIKNRKFKKWAKEIKSGQQFKAAADMLTRGRRPVS